MTKWLRLLGAIMLLLGEVSCSNSSDTSSDGLIIKINPDILDYSEFVQHVEKIRIVPLETRAEAMIGYIYSFDIYGDKIYAADVWSTKSVYIYDLQGKWINTVSSVGKGPSE